MYAATRMGHAWHMPTYINGKPYIDGSYTSICPVLQIAKLGYKELICITTEHKDTFVDLFSEMEIPPNVIVLKPLSKFFKVNI